MFDDDRDRRFIIQFSVCHQLLRLTHDFELLGDRRAKACLTQSRRDAEMIDLCGKRTRLIFANGEDFFASNAKLTAWESSR